MISVLKLHNRENGEKEEQTMKKLIALVSILALVITFVPAPAFAVNTATHGDITGRSVVSGLVSFLIWPGLGQYLNKNETKKNVTHAVLGLTGVFRFWSGWDGLINRQGGRWDGKI